MVRKLVCLFMVLFCVFSLTACGAKQETTAPTPLPIVTIEMEDGHVMRAELYPDIALNSVSNFVNLIEAGFYDGTIFHRVIQTFVIQGGDPTGTGMGGPGHSINGEFSENGFENNLLHERGVLSWARSGDPNSAGSQFFIMHGTRPDLDGKYAAFGKLIDQESLDTLDRIANTGTDAFDRPLIEHKIKKMTVDTKGLTYTTVKNEQ